MKKNYLKPAFSVELLCEDVVRTSGGGGTELPSQPLGEDIKGGTYGINIGGGTFGGF